MINFFKKNNKYLFLILILFIFSFAHFLLAEENQDLNQAEHLLDGVLEDMNNLGNMASLNSEQEDIYIKIEDNQSSLENPIILPSDKKVILELADRVNGQYFFSDSLNLKELIVNEIEVKIYVPDDKNIFVDKAVFLRNVNFENRNNIEIGGARFIKKIEAKKSIIKFKKSILKLADVLAREITFDDGNFSYNKNGVNFQADKIIMGENSSMTVYASWYESRKPLNITGIFENHGILGGGATAAVNIFGKMINSGKISKDIQLAVRGDLENTGIIESDGYYSLPVVLYGNLKDSGSIFQHLYLFNNLDGSKKELIFSRNTSPKIYLQEDIELSKKVREIPFFVYANDHKLILEDGSYLKLKNINELEFVGNNIVLETNILKNENAPNLQVILSGERGILDGENSIKNLVIGENKIKFSGNLYVNSLEIKENSELFLSYGSFIGGKILNKGILSSRYGSRPLVIEDDFTNLGEITMNYIFFKNNYPEYSYFMKEKNNPEAEERLLSLRGANYLISFEIKSKKPYDLIIKKPNGDIFKIFKINQEMELPEIKIPPIEPENLEASFAKVKNILENKEEEIDISFNRNLKITDSQYDENTQELNFYLSTNFQNGSNIFPEVVSIPLDKREIKVRIKISKPMDLAKVYIKNNQGETIGESNFFNVFETQKVFFRIPDKYNRFGQLKVSKILGNNLENLEEVKIISVPNEKYFFW